MRKDPSESVVPRATVGPAACTSPGNDSETVTFDVDGRLVLARRANRFDWAGRSQRARDLTGHPEVARPPASSEPHPASTTSPNASAVVTKDDMSLRRHGTAHGSGDPPSAVCEAGHPPRLVGRCVTAPPADRLRIVYSDVGSAQSATARIWPRGGLDALASPVGFKPSYARTR